MTMEYQLIPEFAEFGSSKRITGNLAIEKLQKGSQRFEISGGVDYRVELSNTGEGILLRGSAKAEGTTECARCLEDAGFCVEGEVESYYVLPTYKLAGDDSDDEFTVIDETGKVDLEIPILAAIISELPQVLFCREDCKGLCPTCGTDLNSETCNCADAINPDNPFYALKDLL